MSDILYIAALLLMFLTLVHLSRSRRHWRDRANEAEFTVSLQKTEISFMSDELEHRRKLTPWAERKNASS